MTKELCQMCDECGRNVTKIWRVENKHKYCVNCYRRVFKRSACPKCGEFYRLNIGNKNAICAACIRAKPCVRCGKIKYESGKITPYGMACKSCARYFRASDPCDSCGAASNRLSRNSRLSNNLRLCPKCINVDFSSCQACRRYRLLSLKNSLMLCKACAIQGEVHCLQCNNLMPAGYGKTCENCYWSNLLIKRTDINCASLNMPKMACHFRNFSLWLNSEVGPNKAAITINKYLSFFTSIEKEFKFIPKYELLLKHFGAAKLRKEMLPMRWMSTTSLVVINAVTREEDTEWRRIITLRDKVKGKAKAEQLLNGYYSYLLDNPKRRSKVKLRSIRLALSPAAHLLLLSAKMQVAVPNQKILEAYLTISPGQRAAITGFVNYIKRTESSNIVIPKLNKDIVRLKRRKKLEVELLQLMEVGRRSSLDRNWLSIALAYFHDLPKSVGKTVTNENILHENDGITVMWNDMKYWVKSMPK